LRFTRHTNKRDKKRKAGRKQTSQKQDKVRRIRSTEQQKSRPDKIRLANQYNTHKNEMRSDTGRQGRNTKRQDTRQKDKTGWTRQDKPREGKGSEKKGI
jgi:hypothetical protein